MGQGGNRFSALLLEGLDHYRKGRMLEAVRAWEEAYLLEPTNLRAREFLRSALERIHAVMSPANKSANPGAPAPAPHPWLPAQPAVAPAPAPHPPGRGDRRRRERSLVDPQGRGAQRDRLRRRDRRMDARSARAGCAQRFLRRPGAPQQGAGAQGKRQGRAPAPRHLRAQSHADVREQDRRDGRPAADGDSARRDHLAEPGPARRFRAGADRRGSLVRGPVRDLRAQAPRYGPHSLRIAGAERDPDRRTRPGRGEARNAKELAPATGGGSGATLEPETAPGHRRIYRERSSSLRTRSSFSRTY